jgi:acyl transferase domain-containing protein
VASLIKVALSLEHGQLPPTVHFQAPNPDIPFERLPIQVQQRLEAWPPTDRPRLAGISAFGFGGSNAHVVVEQAPADESTPVTTDIGPQPGLLFLSARTEPALRALAERYVEFLADDSPSWSDVCYTAARRREHHDCRLAVLADSPQQASKLLAGFLDGQSPSGVWTGRKPYGRALKTAFVYGDGPTRLDLLTRQLALTDWWRALGVVPNVVSGQGVGELAAACAAGILTRDAALSVLAACEEKQVASASDVVSQTAVLPFVSARDGQLHRGPDLQRDHWLACLQQRGGWPEAVGHLRQRQVDACLEIGTHRLTGTLAGSDPPVLELASASLPETEMAAVLPVLGALYARGADFAWGQLPSADGPLRASARISLATAAPVDSQPAVARPHRPRNASAPPG